MKNVNILLVVAVLFMTGFASAATVWNPAANGIVPPAVGNWDDPNNWTNDVPGVVDGKAVFNVAGAAECVVSDTQSLGDLVQGDGGPGGVIRVVDGGSLTTTGGWMAVGYNDTAKLIVEEGGVCNFGGHLWWGMHTGAVGTIEINGGTITGGADFGLGWWFGPADDHGEAHIYVNSGVMNIDHWDGANAIYGDSSIDIQFGTVNITDDGDQADEVQAYIDAGKITGFGGAGTVDVVHVGSTTTITVNDPMNRKPVYTTVLAGDVELSWDNIAEPNHPGASVLVDVLFGTDPEDPNDMVAVVSGLDVTGQESSSVMVSAPYITEPTTYYWQINTDNGGPEVIEGLILPFDVTKNTPPSVAITTPPTATWIDEPIQLEVDLNDDHPEQVTYQWTSDDPNAVFSPSDTVPDPTVTVNYHTGPFTVTVTVDDGFNPVASASVGHDCADNPCQAAVAVIGLDAEHPADIVVDCKINLVDFAALASEWLTDYTLPYPISIE